MAYNYKIGSDDFLSSRLNLAVEYLVAAFLPEHQDSLSIDAKLPNGRIIHIHIAYVKESK